MQSLSTFVLAAVAASHFSLVNAGIYVTNPVAPTTCHGGQSCEVDWIDDGAQPLLNAIGECTVGLYNGELNQVQALQSVDVSTTQSFSFTPNPSAGANGEYYIVFTSNSISGYQSFSASFTLDNMTGSAGGGGSSSSSSAPSGTGSATGTSTATGTAAGGGGSASGSGTSTATATATGTGTPSSASGSGSGTAPGSTATAPSSASSVISTASSVISSVSSALSSASASSSSASTASASATQTGSGNGAAALGAPSAMIVAGALGLAGFFL